MPDPSEKSALNGTVISAIVALAVLVVAGAAAAFLLRGEGAPETTSPAVDTDPAPVTITETLTPGTAVAEKTEAVTATASPTDPTIPPGQPRTEVHTFAPSNRAGDLQPGWTQRGEMEVIDSGCYRSPVALHSDIYSCGPHVLGTQACFPDPTSGIFLCPHGPFSNQFRKLVFTGTVEETGPGQPYPWGLILEDGRECLARQGGAWGGRADGYYGIYSCAGEDQGKNYEVVLAHPDDPVAIDESTNIWTVEVGELGMPDQHFPPPTRIGVTAAYFAAWPD